jgi:hypothetical protein
MVTSDNTGAVQRKPGNIRKDEMNRYYTSLVQKKLNE